MNQLKKVALTLVLMVTCMVASAQSVKGTVKDSHGEPLIGVSILVNGKPVAVTDVDGNFTVSNLSPNTELTASYVGYKPQKMKVGHGSDLSIVMSEEDNDLDEVVVIGFGAVKKRDLTGSVSSVKSEEILQAPVSSVASSLQGRVTGLDINGSELRIRGNRSINGSNAPLVIIDGVQGGSLSDLNPDDVESVDVLKDASSTAIYGSQGANGVIIVTTKKAEAGKMRISYNGYLTMASREQHPDYRSGANYYEARRIAAENAGAWHSADDDLNLFGAAGLAAYKANAFTDYDHLLQRSTTLSTRHSLTMSGGNDRTTGRFSVSYANDGSKWKKSGGTDRYTLRANIDHKLRKWITAGVDFQLTYNSSESSPYQNSPVTGIQLGSPYGYYDEESDTYVIGDELVERPLTASGYVNPLINAVSDDLYKSESKSTNVIANGYLDIHPIDGLSFRSQLEAYLTNTSVGSYTDKGSVEELTGGTDKSTAKFTKGNGTYVEWNNILTYQFKWLPEEHHLTLTALTSWNKTTNDNLSATSYGQTLASNLWYNLASNNAGQGGMTHTSAYTKEQNMSYAFRVNYDWKSRYLFTASLRRDGSSKLAKGHKWDTFPSAALAWRVTEEPWMQKTKSWLNDLKIRATYGVTGNSGIGVYGTQTGLTFANWSFGFQDTPVNRYILGQLDANGSGYYVIGNQDTKWEKSKTFDLGFDAWFVNNRINFTFDWYYTKTTDLILLRSLPTSSGQDGKYATYTNIGATSNRGVEFAINTRNIDTPNFKWNSTLTFSANKEKIDELVDGTNIQVGTDKEDGTLMLGHPIHSYNTYTYDGIWTSAQADQAHQVFKDNDKKTSFEPGDIRVVDHDGDGVIDENKDIGYVGSTTPKWFAGFNNDFFYKNFDLNIYLYARWGQWGESPMANFDPATGGDYTNMNYWVKDVNEGGDLPALNSSMKLFDYRGYQSLWYCDHSFLKVKRISLGYSIPNTALQKIGISKLRVYFTANNPFYVVKDDWMKHRDPEGQQRSYTIGLNINF